MKKANKFFALMLVMACLLAGCGQQNEIPSAGNDTGDSQVESTKELVADEESKTEDTQENVETSTSDTSAEEMAVDHPTAWEVVDSITLGWNLGNTLDAHDGRTTGLNTETCWGNPKATKELIDLVKSAGFNTVRVPVTWYNHMNYANNSIDEKWMDRVEEVVNYVLDNDMICIINVHHDTGAEGWLRASTKNYEKKSARFEAIWQQVAERFKDYDDDLLFEGFNEILDDNNEWVAPSEEATTVVNELNQIFVDTVRASGGNNETRCLIVNTYAAGGNGAVTKNFVLPEDSVKDKLIVEAHIYQPYQFTAEEFPEAITWEHGKGTMEAYLQNMKKTFVKNGIPVIIGEFGCVDKNNMLERTTYTQRYLDVCSKMGIKCIWWDNGYAFKIFDRITNTIPAPDFVEMMITEATGGDYVIDESKFTPAEPVVVVPGNLCQKKDNWGSWANTSTGAAASGSYNGKGMEVVCTNAGTNTWDVQMTYGGLTFEQGVTYNISFDYYATHEEPFSFHFMQNYGDYITFATVELTATTEVQHYEATFTMEKATETKGRLGFDFGGGKMTVPFTVAVENLVLTKQE